MKRRYVYDDDYEYIMDWGKRQKVKTPNNKPNFPTYLKELLETIEGLANESN